jgi:hypothetical protein
VRDLQRTLCFPSAFAITVSERVTETGRPSGMTATNTLIAAIRSCVVL